MNGTKLWITNGSIADVAVVWAKEDDGEIYGYLVETRHAGLFDARYPWQVLDARLRSRPSCPSRTAGSRSTNKFPEVKGAARPARLSQPGALRDRVGAVGAAMACYDWALQYAQQRIQFGKPIGSFQLVQQKLVWMITEITKAQLLCLQLGRLKDAGTARPQQVSMAKMNNVQMALDGARLAPRYPRCRRHRRTSIRSSGT